MSTQKRGDTYYSRIVVPSSLRHIVPRREVVKSLHVQTYSAARLRCAEWEARVFGSLLMLENRGQELSGSAFDAELDKLAGPQAGATGNGVHCTSPQRPAPLIDHPTLMGAETTLATPQVLLSVVTAAYLREHSGGSWTDKTAETIKGCLTDFVEIVGERPCRCRLSRYPACILRKRSGNSRPIAPRSFRVSQSRP